MNRPNSAS